MKRFYKTVTVSGENAILLDGRQAKTPSGNRLVLPSRALADAVAEEWACQGDTIQPLPLTKLANTAVDGTMHHRNAVVHDLVRYGRNDLLCYRAEDAKLAGLQAAKWDPLLDWAATAFGARLAVTTGITHIEQPRHAVEALEHVLRAQDDWVLTGLQTLITITGSLVLGLAVVARNLPPLEAFALSRLEEAFQNQKWGEDHEAKLRTENLARDVDFAGQFIALARA